MKEAISGTWLFQLVIVFILIFTGYLALSLNYSKSFRVKNEVISIIEREEGMTSGSTTEYGAIKLIANYLTRSGYGTMGKCPTDTDNDAPWYGALSIDTESETKSDSLFEQVTDANKEYYYCVKKISGYYEKEPQISYYKVQFFFKFDLPVLGQIGNFKVTGQTIDIQYPQDSDFNWIS